jgi:uncharacterized protein YlxW (UPF0749 family)
MVLVHILLSEILPAVLAIAGTGLTFYVKRSRDLVVIQSATIDAQSATIESLSRSNEDLKAINSDLVNELTEIKLHVSSLQSEIETLRDLVTHKSDIEKVLTLAQSMDGKLDLLTAHI